MEKLIELLNEYEMENDNYSGVISEGDVYYYSVLYISKKFGFIKWLVENEKIDFSNIDFYFLQREQYTKTESLLMLLSIQDEPIKFLVSILK